MAQSLNLSFIQSLNHSIVQSFNHSIVQSFNRSITQSFNQLITQSFNHSVIQLFTQTVIRCLNFLSATKKSKPNDLGNFASMLLSKANEKPNREPVDEFINPTEAAPQFESSPEWNFPDDIESPTENESPVKKSSVSAMFSSNNVQFDDNAAGMNGELAKMRELEAEKQDLQKRLGEARGALDNYTTKLSSQVKDTLVLKFHMTVRSEQNKHTNSPPKIQYVAFRIQRKVLA